MKRLALAALLLSGCGLLPPALLSDLAAVFFRAAMPAPAPEPCPCRPDLGTACR